MTNSPKGLRLARSATAIVALWPAAALAQAAPVEPHADAGVDDIVVTAQRKSERLQDVPISINAISGDDLSAQGISDSFGLSAIVPGLSITRVGNVATPYLRGVGSNAANPNNEASVATYVDGIYYAAPFANLLSFNNVERVEVLKGPQGTLFGRNATGGVIQIVTRDPSQTPSLDLKVGYANFDTYSASAYATTGLAPNLAVDIAVQYQNQREGWGRNVTLNVDQLKGREFAIRSKLLFTPSDRTRITISGDYGDSRNSYNVYNHPNGAPDLDGVIRNLGKYESAGETPSLATTHQHGVALRVEQDFDVARLVSLTARRINRATNQFDYDTSPVAIVSPVITYGSVKTWSQEVQLLAPSGSAFDWTLGAFYFDNKAGFVPAILCGVGVVPTGCLDLIGRQHTRSFSAYAQATVEIMPRTHLTGGIRYTRERQTFESGSQLRAPDGTLGAFSPAPTTKTKFEKPTWRIAIDHKITPDLNVYASYNRGLKSGGFDLMSPANTGYKPEFLDAYEVGVKSSLFDNRVRLNVAGFYYDYKDIQVTGINQQVISTENAAGARIWGIDADLVVKVTPQLRLTAGGSYLNGEFTDYQNPLVYPESILDAPVVLANAKGRKTTRTPEFTGNVGIDYDIDSNVGLFTLSAMLSHNSGFYWEASNRLKQKAYSLLNSSVTWESHDARWSVKLWANNLTDTRYLSQGVSAAVGDLLDYAAPRTYGVTLGAHF
jgi:iron complex outermembrane receptor protein